MKADMLRIAVQTPILAGLSEPLRDRVLEFSHMQDFPAGGTVFLQGEAAKALYVVVDGWIKLYRIAPSGAEAVVMVVTRGRTFGEAVALRDLPYPVSAEATTDTTLLRIDASRLRRQMREDPELAIALLAATYVHLQALVTQVEQLKARSGVQRVAEFLVDLAACEQGRCSVSMPYNKTLIAGRLGMKPESLSRAFGRLRAYGVRVDANVAHIDDLDVLRDLTNEDPGKAWMK